MICPSVSKGGSTGFPPIHVRVKNVPPILHRVIFFSIENLLDRILLDDKGRTNRIAIDSTRAITPPSLLGIDRRMAYANRKYHSG